MATKLLASLLRTKSEDELVKELTIAKRDLSILMQKKHSGIIKKNEMDTCRKNIARIMTIMHENKTLKFYEEHKDKKVLPKELKPKMTRKLREAMTKKQLKLSVVGNGRSRNTKVKCFSFVGSQ